MKIGYRMTKIFLRFLSSRDLKVNINRFFPPNMYCKFENKMFNRPLYYKSSADIANVQASIGLVEIFT